MNICYDSLKDYLVDYGPYLYIAQMDSKEIYDEVPLWNKDCGSCM